MALRYKSTDNSEETLNIRERVALWVIQLFHVSSQTIAEIPQPEHQVEKNLVIGIRTLVFTQQDRWGNNPLMLAICLCPNVVEPLLNIMPDFLNEVTTTVFQQQNIAKMDALSLAIYSNPALVPVLLQKLTALDNPELTKAIFNRPSFFSNTPLLLALRQLLLALRQFSLRSDESVPKPDFHAVLGFIPKREELSKRSLEEILKLLLNTIQSYQDPLFLLQQLEANDRPNSKTAIQLGSLYGKHLFVSFLLVIAHLQDAKTIDRIVQKEWESLNWMWKVTSCNRDDPIWSINGQQFELIRQLRQPQFEKAILDEGARALDKTLSQIYQAPHNEGQDQFIAQFIASLSPIILSITQMQNTQAQTDLISKTSRVLSYELMRHFEKRIPTLKALSEIGISSVVIGQLIEQSSLLFYITNGLCGSFGDMDPANLPKLTDTFALIHSNPKLIYIFMQALVTKLTQIPYLPLFNMILIMFDNLPEEMQSNFISIKTNSDLVARYIPNYDLLKLTLPSQVTLIHLCMKFQPKKLDSFEVNLARHLYQIYTASAPTEKNLQEKIGTLLQHLAEKTQRIEASVVLALIEGTKGNEEEKRRWVSQVHASGSHKTLGLFKDANAPIYQALLTGRLMARDMRYINFLISDYREQIIALLNQPIKKSDKVIQRTAQEINDAVEAAKGRVGSDEDGIKDDPLFEL